MPIDISPGSASAGPAAGDVPAASADSGNPVKVGGVYRLVPPTFADGQRVDAQFDANGNLKTNQRVLNPATDQVGLAAGTIVLAQLYDANGNALRAVSPTSGIFQLQINTNEVFAPAAYNWVAQAFATGTTSLAAITVRNARELVIAVNITVNGTSIQFVYQVQDANGNWITAWTGVATAGTVNYYVALGPGYAAANAISLAMIGRLQVVVVGAGSTITGSVFLRT